jgi:hypothetical protein
MITFILIAVGVLIGLKVQRWREVFIGAASVGVVGMVLIAGTALIPPVERLPDIILWVLGAGLMLSLFSLAVISLTFVIRKANRRPAKAEPEPSTGADQNRDS